MNKPIKSEKFIKLEKLQKNIAINIYLLLLLVLLLLEQNGYFDQKSYFWPKIPFLDICCQKSIGKKLKYPFFQ
jgi:hypothetical protein